MAALLKKRALAEYLNSGQEETVRPLNRLHIVKRSKSSEHWEHDLSAFDNGQAVGEAFQAVLNINQALPLPLEIRNNILKKVLSFLDSVCSLLEEQKILLSGDSSLRPILVSKLFSLLPKLVSATEAMSTLEKIVNVTKCSSSNVVISHGIHTSFILLSNFPSTKNVDEVVNMALVHLKSSSHYLVKVRCLEALGGLCPLLASVPILVSIVEYTSDQDSRVRTAAFTSLTLLQEKDFKLPSTLYESVCCALNDDYCSVREAALHLIITIAEKNPTRTITVPGVGHQIKLTDHAFSQICNSVNDVNVRVRTLAVSLLGSLTSVSDDFLHQTLDKKLMSNMRKKTSAHERAKDIASSGEWSTGKRWGDDAPLEEISASSAQIVSSGSCGAFVHGLEDEYLEVRTAALRSISKLAARNGLFANQCLDFLVDMFNDEIEDVRLIAIQVLQDIAHLIKLRPDQLDEILHALKDSFLDIRESLHSLLAICRLSTTSCVTASVDALLDNQRRYPQDKRSIHKCMKQIGINHSELVLALVPQLLLIHPYFDGVEPSVQDGEYICKLILVLNAASQCSTIIPLLEQHTLRHYAYLRDSMPLLVPHLKIDGESIKRSVVKTNTKKFLSESLDKIINLDRSSSQFQLTIYSTVHSDLERLADIDPSISPAATMAALYIQCMLMFTKILSTRNWLTPSSLSLQQSGALKTYVDLILRNTLKLRYAFSNLSPAEEAAIRSLRVRTLALQLVYVVRGSTGSALGLCDNFLGHIDGLHRYLLQQNLTSDSFIDTVIQELSQLGEPRPGAVARILQPILLSHKIIPLFPIFSDPTSMKMAWAEILEPVAGSETVHKLGAGLVAGVELDAELWHIPDTSCLRIKLSYPDHSNHLILPNASDIRLVEQGCHRLLTTVLISAQVWSEACHVGISLVLDTSEQESLAGRRHPRVPDDSTTTSLCQPVKVLVWPKQIRRGI